MDKLSRRVRSSLRGGLSRLDAGGEFIGGSTQAANVSIVYVLRVNGIDALFTADIERRVAKNVATLLDPALDEPLDIFLATHHGSKEDSIDGLLEVTKPR